MPKKRSIAILRRIKASSIVSALALSLCGIAQAAPQYAVVSQWHIDGDSAWDYLTIDSKRSRLFVTHGNRVEVLDTRSGKSLGAILDTRGVHGIALAQELQRGYASNGRANTMTAFDLNTLATIREVAVAGVNPDAITYDAVGKHVFTFNGKSQDSTIFDAVSLETVGHLSLPGKPEFAVSDGEGRLFVNIETDQGQMAVIDARKLSVAAIWPLDGCSSPSGIALDAQHHRLFSVCENKVMVVTDAQTGHQVAQIPIGSGSDATAFDPVRGLVFSSNGEGSLTVIHQETADRYQVIDTVQTRRGARTLAWEPVSNRLFLATADYGPQPEPTPDKPHPRPATLAGTFTILVAEPK